MFEKKQADLMKWIKGKLWTNQWQWLCPISCFSSPKSPRLVPHQPNSYLQQCLFPPGRTTWPNIRALDFSLCIFGRRQNNPPPASHCSSQGFLHSLFILQISCLPRTKTNKYSSFLGQQFLHIHLLGNLKLKTKQETQQSDRLYKPKQWINALNLYFP